MSELLERIKNDQFAARRARDSFTATALTTLLGEASPSGTQKVTDADVKKVVQKFVKNIRDNAKIVKNDHVRLCELGAELAIFESYLPTKLSDNDLDIIITNYIKYHGCDTLGKVMGMLRSEYEDRYDGKTAAVFAKKRLGG